MKKLLLLLMCFTPGIIYAQGFQVNLNGQKQIGMGHTGTGLLQDGASIAFNPGAMAMLPQNYVQAGISPLWFKSGFSGTCTLSIAKLTAKGAKGAVATIPDVTAIPYFNTVTISAILAGVQKANSQVKDLYISARTSSDLGTTTYASRAATLADLVVLTFPTGKIGQLVNVPGIGMVPYGLTLYAPIANQYVLDANEAALTKDYVVAYNTTIKNIAAQNGLAVFDAFTFLNDIKAHGILVDGVSASSGYISGGIFSLDGVHLTPRGYALVANEYIKAINKTYNASIPTVNVANYRGVKFP